MRLANKIGLVTAAGSGMFPPLYTSTLMAGERSGELEQVLRRWQVQLKRFAA